MVSWNKGYTHGFIQQNMLKSFHSMYLLNLLVVALNKKLNILPVRIVLS